MENNQPNLNDLILNSILEKIESIDKKLNASLKEYISRRSHDKTITEFLLSMNEQLEEIYKKNQLQNSLLVKLIPKPKEKTNWFGRKK
jgi:exonuclease VII small subunit